ncbi:MAG: YceI family protein [Acidimicrobiia bacterium]
MFDSSIDTSVQPLGRVELALERLTSGNSVYDAELMRRLEARRYPLTTVELSLLDRAGHHNRYQVQGDLTVHGVTRNITGTLAVEIDGDGTVGYLFARPQPADVVSELLEAGVIPMGGGPHREAT